MKPERLRATRLPMSLRCEVGEGPVWDDRLGVLYFVDITAGRLHRFHPASGELATRELGIALGCAALTPDPGVLLVARNLELLHYDWNEHTLTPIAAIAGPPAGHRCNDGKPDARGRFWVGTMEHEGRDRHGALHVLASGGGSAPALRRVGGPFGISNGLGWSPDHSTFYHIDSLQRRVDRYAFDVATGRLGPRETAIDLGTEPGLPDGMTVDAQGRLWIAFWDGGAVKCFEPWSPVARQVIELPCAKVASCEFGGADLADLYITTADRGLDASQRAAQPDAGAVFVCRPGAVGRRAHRVRASASLA